MGTLRDRLHGDSPVLDIHSSLSATLSLLALLLAVLAPRAVAGPGQDGSSRYEQVRELEDLALRHGFGSAEYQRAVESLLELWEEFSFLDPADPALPLDLRLAAGDCARLVAQMDTIGRIPSNWTRRTVLARARDFLPMDLTAYPRELRTYLELDFIEEAAWAGDYDQALELIAHASVQLGDSPHVLAELGVMHAGYLQTLGRYEEALDAVVAARSLLQTLSSEQKPRAYVPHMANVVEGLTLNSLGLPDRASGLLAACQSALGRGESPDSEGMVITLATQLALARDDFQWIVQTLVPRLESGGFRGDTPEQTAGRWLDVAVARARGALRSGEDIDTAYNALNSAYGSRELRSAAEMDGPLTLAELELAMGDYQAADQRIRRLRGELEAILSPSARLPRQAVAEIEGRLHLQKESSLTELQTVHQELQRGFLDLMHAWDSAPDRDGGVGFLLFDRRATHLATLIRVTARLYPGKEGARRALQYVIEADRRTTLSKRLDVGTPQVSEILSELVPADGGLLVYVPSRAQSVLFVVTADDIQLQEAASVHSLREWTTQWVSDWFSESGGTSDKSANGPEASLRDGLIPPELESQLLDWSSIAVVGAEAMGFPPFEALQPRRTGTPLLGRSHEVWYLPSLSVGLHLDRQASAPSTLAQDSVACLVIGMGEVIDFNGRVLEALPWRASDLEALAGNWPSGSFVLENEAASSRATVVGAGSRGVQVLEIIAHGVQDLDRERSQGLAFGQDQRVFADDLSGNPTPPLVVLAVCDAGRGAMRAGDEGSSTLGGAFLASGTRTVLLSRHDLSYQASIALLSAFNRNLSEGTTVAQSMCMARRELAADPRWSHPKFHSLLHVYGDGSQSLPWALSRANSRARSWPWILVLVVSAAAALFVTTRLVRRRLASTSP